MSWNVNCQWCWPEGQNVLNPRWGRTASQLWFCVPWAYDTPHISWGYVCMDTQGSEVRLPPSHAVLSCTCKDCCISKLLVTLWAGENRRPVCRHVFLQFWSVSKLFATLPTLVLCQGCTHVDTPHGDIYVLSLSLCWTSRPSPHTHPDPAPHCQVMAPLDHMMGKSAQPLRNSVYVFRSNGVPQACSTGRSTVSVLCCLWQLMVPLECCLFVVCGCVWIFVVLLSDAVSGGSSDAAKICVKMCAFGCGHRTHSAVRPFGTCV